MEYDTAIRENEPKLYATIWVNLTDIMLSERKRIHKSISCMIPPTYSLKTGKIIPIVLEFEAVVTLGGAVMEGGHI